MQLSVTKSVRRHLGPMAWAGVVVVVLYASCSPPNRELTGRPQNLTRESVSVVDGMILLDHPGPKGQGLKKDATTDYFCDIPELINAVRDPEPGHAYTHAYVQAFDGREWGSYPDGWVEISRPVYVLGSDRIGAMGPTLVPFLETQAAQAFVQKYGGRILQFAELTPEVLAEHRRRSRDMLRKGDMGGHMNGHGHGASTPVHSR